MWGLIPISFSFQICHSIWLILHIQFSVFVNCNFVDIHLIILIISKIKHYSSQKSSSLFLISVRKSYALFYSSENLIMLIKWNENEHLFPSKSNSILNESKGIITLSNIWRLVDCYDWSCKPCNKKKKNKRQFLRYGLHMSTIWWFDYVMRESFPF